MEEYSNYLDYFINAIELKQETTLKFEYPKWYDMWNTFRHITDIGTIIEQNDYVTYRGEDPDNEIKGTFIKIDDNLYAQVSLNSDESAKKTIVQIEIFKKDDLQNRINKFFNHESDDKLETLYEISSLDNIEIILPKNKTRK